MANILVCTLGQNWAVIPEAFSFLSAPDKNWLYANHPQREHLLEVRQQYGLCPVDEIWVCTTDSAQISSQIAQVKLWHQRLPRSVRLRIFIASELGNVGHEQPGIRVREMIFRAVLSAACRVGNSGKLFVSLAGGRKMMAADLQHAAHIFGADVVLHVLAPGQAELSETMRKAQVETFLAPLRCEDCKGLYPTIVSKKNTLWSEIAKLVKRRFTSADFVLPIPEHRQSVIKFRATDHSRWLCQLLEQDWTIESAIGKINSASVKNVSA